MGKTCYPNNPGGVPALISVTALEKKVLALEGSKFRVFKISTFLKLYISQTPRVGAPKLK